MRDDSEWLTLGQAARFLGVAQSTIRKWSDQGRVPAFYTPGGHRRYRRADLETFLERSGPGGQAKSGPLVLLVDDDENVRELVRINLEFEGYTVREAADADRRARSDRRGEARPCPPRRDDAARRRLGDAAPHAGALRRRLDPGRDVQRQGRRAGGRSRQRAAARRHSSASRSTCSSSSSRRSSSRRSEPPSRALDRRASLRAARRRLRLALADRSLGRRVARACVRARAPPPQPTAFVLVLLADAAAYGLRTR